MIRIHLLTPTGGTGSPETYNTLFTIHGVAMIFFFLIPSIPAVPSQFPDSLDDRREGLAFPKITLHPQLVLVHRRRLFLCSIPSGTVGLTTGWTFYTPLRRSIRIPPSSRSPSAFLSTSSLPCLHRPQLYPHHSHMRASRHDLVPSSLFVWAHYATAWS